MDKFEQANAAVFKQGKKDASLGNAPAQGMDEVWQPAYDRGFTGGEQ